MWFFLEHCYCISITFPPYKPLCGCMYYHVESCSYPASTLSFPSLKRYQYAIFFHPKQSVDMPPLRCCSTFYTFPTNSFISTNILLSHNYVNIPCRRAHNNCQSQDICPVIFCLCLTNFSIIVKLLLHNHVWTIM